MDMTPVTAQPNAPRCADLRESARAIETAFVEEMLKQARLNEAPETFSGGAGEEQFSSFLTHEMAGRLTARQGLGLAEQVFAQLARGTGCEG